VIALLSVTPGVPHFGALPVLPLGLVAVTLSVSGMYLAPTRWNRLNPLWFLRQIRGIPRRLLVAGIAAAMASWLLGMATIPQLGSSGEAVRLNGRDYLRKGDQLTLISAQEYEAHVGAEQRFAAAVVAGFFAASALLLLGGRAVAMEDAAAAD
jgi:hypothetical protein